MPEKNNYDLAVNAWFKPDHEFTDMLEEYSRSGGTHHSALVYEADGGAMQCFADELGWDFKLIK